MKYKVGDRVKIRADLSNGEYYGANCVVSPMLEYRGGIVTLTAEDDGYGFLIAEDAGEYGWPPEMFEGLAE